ncbi:hypothetical protein AB0L42_37930 [Streptomyces sp. NPDC052287]|uniref:hypothetical protein n=1 Tax=Streptomyces sp. NPDC052287 TaxID=3154950 RepID=UPI0034338524
MAAPASASAATWTTAAPPPELRSREDELQRLRRRMRQVAEFVHDDRHDLDTRQRLAEVLEIPAPISRQLSARVTEPAS